MHEKTDDMATTAGNLGLKVSTKKTKGMRMNTRVQENIKLNGDEIEEVDDFTYLGSKMSNTGDGEVEIRALLAKASQAFASLRSTWKARNIRLNTKLRIFKSNVISTLLYGSESWKVTKTISSKLDVFQNRCLRRILQIYWPNTITNEELHRNRTHLHPSQTKALAMDIARAPPADYSINQNCPTMDSRRPKKERPPQGNLEENSREGDEGKGLDMGPSGACLS